jgi:3-deoxy-7-phosphoheptulonate synthase
MNWGQSLLENPTPTLGIDGKEMASAGQQPTWPDPAAVLAVRDQLAKLPGLVTESECEQFRAELGAVARGETLLLQGGDCAERFAEATRCAVLTKINLLHSLADQLARQVGRSVVRCGRIAGQYAKPRSVSWERLADGSTVPVYRGDAVNDPEPTQSARVLRPGKLLRAYSATSSVLQILREQWHGQARSERVFAAHEALLLDYELPLVRAGLEGPYASSGHYLWIGDRTRFLNGAHVRLAGSITNPIGVKVGPTATAHEVVQLANVLNADRIHGRLTIITRMGCAHIDELLPPIVAAVQASHMPVIWLCDPMHGNTLRSRSGYKVRCLDQMCSEISSFTRILHRFGCWPGGLHLEVTPDDVTECVSVSSWLAPMVDLPRYRSACDPRLDAEQAKEIVGHFGSLIRQHCRLTQSKLCQPTVSPNSQAG